MSEEITALIVRWRETAREIDEGPFGDDPGNHAEVQTLRECASQLHAVLAASQPAPAEQSVSVSVRMPAPGEDRTAYQAYLDATFAPVQAAVARLRKAAL